MWVGMMTKTKWEIWYDPENNSWTLCGEGKNQGLDGPQASIIRTFETEAESDEANYDKAKEEYEKIFDSEEPA